MLAYNFVSGVKTLSIKRNVCNAYLTKVCREGSDKRTMQMDTIRGQYCTVLQYLFYSHIFMHRF